MSIKRPPDEIFALGREHARALPGRSIGFKHEGHEWQYVDRAFCLVDPQGLKFAVIWRRALDRPITSDENNTHLTVRKYGQIDWDFVSTSSIEDALSKGSNHAHQYKAQYLSEWIRDGTTDMPVRQRRVLREFEKERRRSHCWDRER